MQRLLDAIAQVQSMKDANETFGELIHALNVQDSEAIHVRTKVFNIAFHLLAQGE